MASASESSPEQPEQLLGGKIRLLSRIGRGGMGDVWIARNEATHAEVAVKTLQRSERTQTHDERFRREARLAATISHRNVVRIFDLVDEEDGTLGLVMELLRGGTLEACMREQGPMSTLHAIAVAVPILSALHHVHEKGIVHRDVKPANIFFAVEPDGHVIPKVLDFGIAKLPTASSPLTVDGSVLGTPHYMSPEQIRGAEDLDGRSDMFSVAVLVFEMLTGERIFQRDSAAASLAAVLEHEVDPDARIEPRIWLALSRALAKRPYERFATCAELAEALRNAVDASDEDFAAALQELRPRAALPESDSFRVSAMSSSGSRGRTSKRPPRSKNLAWTLAAAGGAAVLAVAVTLAVTRTSAPVARADDTVGVGLPVAKGAGAGGGIAASTPTSTPTTTSTDLGDVGTTPAKPHTSSPPAPLSTPLVPTPLAAKVTTPGGANRGPIVRALAAPPVKPVKPPGAAKPVATSPGF